MAASLLVFAIIVVLLAGLCVWLVDLVPIPAPANIIAKVLIVILAILIIANRAGFL